MTDKDDSASENRPTLKEVLSRISNHREGRLGSSFPLSEVVAGLWEVRDEREETLAERVRVAMSRYASKTDDEDPHASPNTEDDSST